MVELFQLGKSLACYFRGDQLAKIGRSLHVATGPRRES